MRFRKVKAAGSTKAGRTHRTVGAAARREGLGAGVLSARPAEAFLAALPPASVDLVFADPPYNAGREAWDATRQLAEYVAWCRGWLALAARALKPTGSLYLCGFSEVLADLKPVALEVFREAAGAGATAGRRRRGRPGHVGCRWLVWHYRNKANLGADWGRAHESVLHVRMPGFALNVDAARVPYNAHTVRYPERPQAETSRYGEAGYRWRPHPLGAKPRDVIEVPTLANGMREKTGHPTQKPLELVRRLVAAATREGELVLDPFAGSGTTFVACELLDRRWVGAETSRVYRAIIRRRLSRVAEEAAGVEAEARRRAQRARLR